MLQSSVFRMASATEEDVVGNIKNMKRTALRNQTQMIGKIDEVCCSSPSSRSG